MHPNTTILVGLATCAAIGLALRSAADEGDTSASRPADHDVTSWLAELELPLHITPGGSVSLRWSAPTECVGIYRVRIDEEMPERVARFFNRQPEHSQTFLITAPHSRPEGGVDDRGRPVVRGRVFATSDNAGVRPLESTEPLPIALARDYRTSELGVGPSAPDAACRNRSWDAIEDALALGWPWLAEHRVAPGDSWSGARVEGRCNETACLTSDGMAGPRAHGGICATPPWRERLVARVSAGGQRFAAIESHWQDREDLDEIEGGTITRRRALISETDGRLAWSDIEVSHRWSEIRRHVVIESIDDCPGSLRAAGWKPAPELEQGAAQARLAFETREAGSEG